MLFFKIAYDGRGTLCQSIMVGVEHTGTLWQDLVWPKNFLPLISSEFDEIELQTGSILLT